jgi:hypothetical protein
MTNPQVTPPPDDEVRLSRRAVMTSVSVLALLLIVLGVVLVALLGAQPAAAAPVELEATSTTGANPFMPPAGADAPTVVPPPGADGNVSGGTPGLFGGSGDDETCDREQMSRFLQQNPDKAVAWGAAAGVDTDDIPAFLRDLTPMILRVDTYVTNHGFADGRLTSYPAVLQAGTAVLIDGYGTPRVKCYCGNPLTLPPPGEPQAFQGHPWPRFTPTAVTVIEPTSVPVHEFTTINITDNRVYVVVPAQWQWGRPECVENAPPSSRCGEPSTPLDATTPTGTTTSTTPTTTTTTTPTTTTTTTPTTTTPTTPTTTTPTTTTPTTTTTTPTTTRTPTTTTTTPTTTSVTP